MIKIYILIDFNLFLDIFYTKTLGNCVFTPSQARTKAQYKVNSKGTSVLSRYSSNMDSSISGNRRCSGSTKIRKKRKTSEREDTNVVSIAKRLRPSSSAEISISVNRQETNISSQTVRC